jgi:hypothetical protein
MPAVEANEGESDEAKSALDIMSNSFTDSRACRQPPERLAQGLRSPVLRWTVLHSFGAEPQAEKGLFSWPFSA